MDTQTAADQRQRPPRGFWRRNTWVLLLVGLVALVIAVTGVTWIGQQNTLAEQQTRIRELDVQVKAATLRQSERIETDVFSSLGYSRARLSRDTPFIAGLVRTAFTWDSGAAYEQARQELKRRYKLTDDDPFLANFMPPSRFNEDASGRRYYYLDAQGVNSSVNGTPEIDVNAVAAGEYTYTVLVNIGVTSDAVKPNKASPARVTADRTVLLQITVDNEQRISELTGVPAHGSPRKSG